MNIHHQEGYFYPGRLANAFCWLKISKYRRFHNAPYLTNTQLPMELPTALAFLLQSTVTEVDGTLRARSRSAPQYYASFCSLS